MSMFNDLLFKVPEGINVKLARTESPDELQFEKDFSRLAYAFIKDKASQLLQYMVGFEIVDRAEDGTRAVGLFGFKINDKFYYVPAFFLNNQIKGMDILFCKDDNTMVPLTEEFIQNTLNTQPVKIGEKGTMRDRKDFITPDFRFLTLPPQLRRLGKSAAVAVLNQMAEKIRIGLEKDASFQEMLLGVAGAALCEDIPYARKSTIIDFLEKKGGIGATETFLNTIIKSASFRKSASAFYRLPEDFSKLHYAPGIVKVAAERKITVITKDYGGSCCSPESSDDKKKLIKDTFVIKDTRDEDEKSELYDIDYVKRFSTPAESGVYDVILSGGRVAECYVLKGGGHMLVVNPSNGAYQKRSGSRDYSCGYGGWDSSFGYKGRMVYARDEKKGEGSEIFDKAISMDKVEPEKRYAVVNAKGDFCCVYTVNSITKEGDEIIQLDGYCEEQAIRPNAHINRLILSDRPGASTFIGTDQSLVLGKEWKLLKLNQEYKLNDSIELGTIDDLLLELNKKANVKEIMIYGEDMMDPKFTIALDGVMESQKLNYKNACVRLVSVYGLGVPDAEQLLKTARDNKKVKSFIKLAQVPEPNLPGVTMPQPPDPMKGYDEFTGIPVEYANNKGVIVAGQTTGKPFRQNPMTPGFNLYTGPGPNMGQMQQGQVDMGAQDLAAQAMQSGQKQVFDHATIGGLAKIYDVGGIVDQYIPSMMDTLDKLGRIMFLFYWKNEDFAERYGEDNLQEMEDLMGGVFKQLGTFILELKEKAVGNDQAIM